MSSLQKLREQNTQLSKEANHLLAEKGDRIWTKDDQQKFDGLMDQADLCRNQIDAYQRKLEADSEESFNDVDEFKIKGKTKLSAAQAGMDIFLRKSFKEMSNDEALMIRNTMSTTTGSEGGFSVQTEIAQSIVDAKKSFAFMRQEASQVTTTQGNPMSFPTTDGTSELGEWVAQNTSAATADIVMGTVAVNCFKAGSKVITVPIELLQDSNIDVQGLVFKRMNQRIGRIENVGFTTGTGTGQPNGVVTAAATGKTGLTGQTLTIIYDDLVDMIDSIDVAYIANAMHPCFMFNQTMRKVIRKIKDTAGRPIWTPSYDAGFTKGIPDQLLGFDVCINNDFAVPAANAKSLAFGDFSQYLIRDSLDVSLFRFDDSAFMSKGQIGFLSWARTGGNLLDVAAVKLYVHSAT